MSENPNPPTKVVVQLPEVIDERVDFVKVIGKSMPDMLIDCSQLKRINSVGVRNLKIALNRLRIDGSKLTFVGISPPLTEAMDFVSNLIPEEATIESIYLPYCCTGCGLQFQELNPYAGLSARRDQLMTAVCPKCGKSAEFDNLPEIYFKD